MRAEVAGAQIEGTPEELASFLRLYSQPEAQSARLLCDMCGRSYGSKDSLGAHKRNKHGVHKRQKRQVRASKKLKDAPDPDPKLDKQEKVVLARLYDLPAQSPERAQRGKTAVTIARELGEKSRQLPHVLRGLVNKGYAIEFPNPFDPVNPMYFRKVELAPVASS